MAPLLHRLSTSSQMHLNSEDNQEEIVEGNLKWQSPTSSNKSSAKSPSMPRRSEPSLDDALLAMSSKEGSDNSLNMLFATSSKRTPPNGNNKNKSFSSLDLNMSFSSFAGLVEEGISPAPRMPHRRTSTDELMDDGLAWQSNHTAPQDFYMDLNDQTNTEKKKKVRRVRRGVQRAFSDSELSEASTIKSTNEEKKERKKSLLQRRKERLARKLLGVGSKKSEEEPTNEEDDDVEDTDKDLEGFTGIALKKSKEGTDETLIWKLDRSRATSVLKKSLADASHRSNTSTTDEVETVMTKTQSEIDLETRSRVSKSPARFPSRDRSSSRGRARPANSVTAGEEKKKKRSSVSRTKRLSNRKKNSSDESSSEEEEEEEEKARSKSRGGSKSPARREKSKGARRMIKKGGRKPAPIPDDNSMSQRTMTDLVIDVQPATQEFVSPCTIGSGRRSIMDALTPTTQSRDSRVSGITMSTFDEHDFSSHSGFTQSSLRGPQHIPGFGQLPDLEASERGAREDGSEHINSLLVTGHLSAVFESSDGLAASGRTLGLSGRTEKEEGSLATPRTPRSSLQMPTLPRRRPSTDKGLPAFGTQGPLFDSSHRSMSTRDEDLEEEDVPFDRFAPSLARNLSNPDLLTADVAKQQRPMDLLRKASSERNLGSNLGSSLKSGAARVWRRGKKKPLQEEPEQSED